ncbi:MAG: restriction endonuclease subunit S [Methanobacteriaceae archaeon]|jgi:type I restriction enzyme S subunit|nr:restriction endonuclease subunit S [Candidatus Methanorudis spinitermitis]
MGCVPELRFKEFSGEWKRNHLGNICKVQMGQSPSSKNYTENPKDTILIQGNADLIKGKVVPRIFTTEITKISESNDIIMTVRAPVGDLAINEFNACIGRGVCSIKANEFIYHLLHHIKERNLWAKFSQGSTIDSVNSKDINNLKIKIPLKEEQDKVANFLSKIDEKIAILEDKLQLWETYKKGIMQQLFSQELRFKDDNGNSYPDWEEKTLGDLGSTYTGLSGKTKGDFGKGKPYITYKSVFDSQKIDTNKVDFVKINSNESQNSVEYGDIFFTTSSETPEEVGMAAVLLNSINECYLNSFCFGFRLNSFEEVNPIFFSFYLRSSIIRNEINRLAQGSTRFNLSKNSLMKISIMIPILKEQEKIARFSMDIDNKTNEIYHELQSNDKFKKGLLQKMFC